MFDEKRQSSFGLFAHNRAAFFGAIFLIFLILLFLIFAFFPRHSPTEISDHRLESPSSHFWFGTDIHGRDLFSRTLFGLRLSLSVGIFGALVSLFIGTIWGGISAYLGGRIDAFLMRFVDVFYAMPSIIFVIVLMAGYDGIAKPVVEKWIRWSGLNETSETTIRLGLLYFGLGSISWLTAARIIRGEVLSIKGQTFVLASKVLGCSSTRIFLFHILPNLTGLLIVYLMLTIPTIILYESFLSFLGLGIQPPHASLGILISEGARAINPIRVYWWMILFPSAGLVMTLLSLNFVGEALRTQFQSSK